MPSDSQFAIAMKSQKEAERAEQQRIKNLVLNYDLGDSSLDHTGTDNDLFSHPYPNVSTLPSSGPATHNLYPKGPSGEKQQPSHHQLNASLHQSPATNHVVNAKSSDRSGSSRRIQQARKLQLSDVDWYGSRHD